MMAHTHAMAEPPAILEAEVSTGQERREAENGGGLHRLAADDVPQDSVVEVEVEAEAHAGRPPPPRPRRPCRGAAEVWEAVEALSAAAARHGQRFRPPRPERRPCHRFLLEGVCQFGNRCTHAHVREDPADPQRAAPRVCIHKLADRKVGRGTESMLLQTLGTGGFSTRRSQPEDADLLLANAFPPPPLLAKLRPGCVVNHFPGEQELGAKDRLARLLCGLGLCPETFVLPEDRSILQHRLCGKWADSDKVWIVKPCQQGEGRHIQVLRGGYASLTEAGVIQKPCVVSEYIADPLLVDGRKVDLRVYVLVTHVQPDVEAFIFRDGLVRICGEPYDLSAEGLQRARGHISNNAVQTKTVRHACALNWTLPQLWAWLDCFEGGPRSSLVWSRICRVVRDALEAWQPVAELAAARPSVSNGPLVSCYSLLAFDLLVDCSGAVWLLEVNPKPALHAQSASLKAVFPVHFEVKSALLADLFSVLGLPLEAGGPGTRRPLAAKDGGHFGFELLRPSAAQPRLRFALGSAAVWGRVAALLGTNSTSSLVACCPRWAQAPSCLAGA